jgi:orotidine-5'-phosphate decarboxylase
MNNGHPAAAAPEPIVALDVHSAALALDLVAAVEAAPLFVKVGLQLFTAEGPDVVRRLRRAGCRVFLDLKLHDIPSTVARAVESAAALDVELLTVHASGGPAMLEAAQAAAARAGVHLLGVTVLTSMDAPQVEAAWGATGADVGAHVARLATLAADAGLHGVVASAHEVALVREATGGALRVLTPGIRLAGDAADDQARVATPARAARLGADYLVLGRTVTAADRPAAAYRRVLDDLRTPHALEAAR